MRLTPCDCKDAGWCERHRCEKSFEEFNACRRDQEAFALWEKSSLIPSEPSVPGAHTLLQRAGNFASAMTAHALNGLQHVDDTTYEARLTLCRDCELCDPSSMVCRHASCGCRLLVKARWRSSRCPIGLWPAST